MSQGLCTELSTPTSPDAHGQEEVEADHCASSNLSSEIFPSAVQSRGKVLRFSIFRALKPAADFFKAMPFLDYIEFSCRAKEPPPSSSTITPVHLRWIKNQIHHIILEESRICAAFETDLPCFGEEVKSPQVLPSRKVNQGGNKTPAEMLTHELFVLGVHTLPFSSVHQVCLAFFAFMRHMLAIFEGHKKIEGMDYARLLKRVECAATQRLQQAVEACFFGGLDQLKTCAPTALPFSQPRMGEPSLFEIWGVPERAVPARTAIRAAIRTVYPHQHCAQEAGEYIYLGLSGEGMWGEGEQQMPITPGQIFHCVAGMPSQLRNMTPVNLRVFCVML